MMAVYGKKPTDQIKVSLKMIPEGDFDVKFEDIDGKTDK